MSGNLSNSRNILKLHIFLQFLKIVNFPIVHISSFPQKVLITVLDTYRENTFGP